MPQAVQVRGMPLTHRCICRGVVDPKHPVRDQIALSAICCIGPTELARRCIQRGVSKGSIGANQKHAPQHQD